MNPYTGQITQGQEGVNNLFRFAESEYKTQKESNFGRSESHSEEAETKPSANAVKEQNGTFKRSRKRSRNCYDSISTETRRALMRLTME